MANNTFDAVSLPPEIICMIIEYALNDCEPVRYIQDSHMECSGTFVLGGIFNALSKIRQRNSLYRNLILVNRTFNHVTKKIFFSHVFLYPSFELEKFIEYLEKQDPLITNSISIWTHQDYVPFDHGNQCYAEPPDYDEVEVLFARAVDRLSSSLTCITIDVPHFKTFEMLKSTMRKCNKLKSLRCIDPKSAADISECISGEHETLDELFITSHGEFSPMEKIEKIHVRIKLLHVHSNNMLPIPENLILSILSNSSQSLQRICIQCHPLTPLPLSSVLYPTLERVYNCCANNLKNLQLSDWCTLQVLYNPYDHESKKISLPKKSALIKGKWVLNNNEKHNKNYWPSIQSVNREPLPAPVFYSS